VEQTVRQEPVGPMEPAVLQEPVVLMEQVEQDLQLFMIPALEEFFYQMVPPMLQPLR
jgi:hypothetical protein